MGELLAFTADHVRRLTTLSVRQLRYWDKTEFFKPQFVTATAGHRPFGRFYSFRDVVGLRTIAILRRDHNVSLQELRRVGRWLIEQRETPWSNMTFYVAGRHVYFDDPRTGARMGARFLGHPVLPIAMEEIAQDMHVAAQSLRTRTSAEIGRVDKYRYVAHNAPVLAGTRISTRAVWNLHQAGYDPAAIIREFPRLMPADVEAAIAHEEQLRRSRAS
ncbi:MAG TPA: DUF433 domain-containing protein [Dehalococcoidia bacterium]|nr:DUF433 domain-containing protein [Dehalococcoidia bacterium]